jgi:hypothetical protein
VTAQLAAAREAAAAARSAAARAASPPDGHPQSVQALQARLVASERLVAMLQAEVHRLRDGGCGGAGGQRGAVAMMGGGGSPAAGGTTGHQLQPHQLHYGPQTRGE